jgi:TetR/AcrR family transcriptional repressor of nem operon
MAERYVDRFDGLLRELKAKHRPGLKRLEALKAVYTKVLSEGKFCICGMLASDLAALPESAKVKLQEFFTMNERWIAEAVEDAQKAKQLRVNLDPKRAAALFFAVLEGGMLIARTQCHPKFLEQVIEQLIEQMQE